MKRILFCAYIIVASHGDYSENRNFNRAISMNAGSMKNDTCNE